MTQTSNPTRTDDTIEEVSLDEVIEEERLATYQHPDDWRGDER